MSAETMGAIGLLLMFGSLFAAAGLILKAEVSRYRRNKRRNAWVCPRTGRMTEDQWEEAAARSAQRSRQRRGEH